VQLEPSYRPLISAYGAQQDVAFTHCYILSELVHCELVVCSPFSRVSLVNVMDNLALHLLLFVIGWLFLPSTVTICLLLLDNFCIVATHGYTLTQIEFCISR
jgi:hypothetical protein